MLIRVNRTPTPVGNLYTITRHDDGIVLLSTYSVMGSVIDTVGDRSEVYFDWPHDPALNFYDVEAGGEVPAPSPE